MQYVAFKCTPAIFLLNKDSVNHGITSTVPEDGYSDPTQMQRTFSDCPAGTAGTGLDASYHPDTGTPGYAHDPYASEVLVKCEPVPQAEALAQLPPGASTNTNLYGSDIPGSGPMTTNDPTVCYNICKANKDCLAWTYVHPGVQGQSAVCYLKNPTPAATKDDCCISGVVRVAISKEPLKLLKKIHP